MPDRVSLPPILVTGAHRSGTTWVGRMLAADSRTAYVSEPLNVLHRPGVLGAPVRRWYTYIDAHNEAEYLPAFEDLLDFDYHLWAEIRSLRSRKDLFRAARDFWTFARGALAGRRALLKDPFAVFSSPWFAERLGCRVVITVRHPAAFAASLKRLAWSFDFHDLLDQPALMRAHLEPDRSDMRSIAETDIIGQAALLWRMIYRTVNGLQKVHPDFIVVRHEDLSLDPPAGFRGLYERLGLDFTPRVESIVRKASSSENPAEASRQRVHTVKLDSRANIENWRKHLTSDELQRIRAITGEVVNLYYPNPRWEPA